MGTSVQNCTGKCCTEHVPLRRLWEDIQFLFNVELNKKARKVILLDTACPIYILHYLINALSVAQAVKTFKGYSF